ncbi:DUF3630 family protein [Thalassotalea fusca]
MLNIKISLENQRSAIVFTPVRQWQDEEISGMINWFFTRFTQCVSREHILGADRVSERFEWQSREYVLNFESYSQSVWIEAFTVEVPDSAVDLTDLYLYINHSLANT